MVWHNIRFASGDIDLNIPLQPFRYQMIRGIDFYQYMRRELTQFPNVKFLNRMVNGWQDGEENAQVWVDGEVYNAKWVFESRLNPADIQPDSTRNHYLKQHLTGWEIEGEAPVINPDIATLFDLRTHQNSGLSFFYVLPFSNSHALVEYTIFSTELLPSEEIRLVFNGKHLLAAEGQSFDFPAVAPGVYRVEAWIDRTPWIFSNPIWLAAPTTEERLQYKEQVRQDTARATGAAYQDFLELAMNRNSMSRWTVGVVAVALAVAALSCREQSDTPSASRERVVDSKTAAAIDAEIDRLIQLSD